MAIFYGTWAAQTPQRRRDGQVKLGNLGQPLQTEYLRLNDPSEISELRGRMLKFYLSLQRLADAETWAGVDRMFDIQQRLPAIGNDPSRYTLEKIVTDSIEHLTSQRRSGQLKDLTRSFIDRYNYLLALSAAGITKNDPSEDLEALVDMLAERYIDIRDPQHDRLQAMANFHRCFSEK